MSELIALIESTHKKPFFEAILEAIEPEHLGHSGFSEYESYGNFITLKYPQSFVAINRKRDRFAKRILGTPNARLLRYYARDFEVVGFEVWTNEDKRFSKILKMRIFGAFFRLFPPKFYAKIYKIIHKMRF